MAAWQLAWNAAPASDKDTLCHAYIGDLDSFISTMNESAIEHGAPIFTESEWIMLMSQNCDSTI